MPAAVVLQRLNAERARDGIPADVTERPEWSRDCARHNAYERAHGGVLTHSEQPGSPGYSDGGDWAARMSVLASGADSDVADPFASAPLHLDQVLAPALAETGIDDSQEHLCVVTLAGRTRPTPAADTILTSPGDGRTDVPAAERAAEQPFVPGDFTDPPTRGTTGPELLVFARGPSFEGVLPRIVDASLAGPDGPVEVRWVDSATPTVGPYLAPGGIVIPVTTLRSGAQYAASVTLEASGVRRTHAWTFVTDPAPGPAPVSPSTGVTAQDVPPGLVHEQVHLRLKARGRRRWVVGLRPDAHLAGRRLIVDVTVGHGRAVRQRVWVRSGTALVVRRPQRAGRVVVLVLGAPFVAADGTPVIVDASRRAFR